VDSQYFAYGPLLDAMRGKKWVLEPHCVAVEHAAAKINLFAVAGGYVMPVTFGDRTATVRVRLQNLPGLSVRDTCEVLYPEVEKWTPLTIAAEKGTLVLDVPLERGCALVRFQH